MAETPSILLVDDDADDLASVERALRSLACELVPVKDPHGVLPSVHRHRPAVVILDALLPGLSGFDLCKQIKTDPQLKGTQVLILTGVYLRQQYRQEALQQFKADAFLTKPFRPPELQRLVVQLLSRRTKSPPGSFLRRGAAPAAESRKRGFFDRIFRRGEKKEEEEEALATRIVPAPEVAATPVASQSAVETEAPTSIAPSPEPAPSAEASAEDKAGAEQKESTLPTPDEAVASEASAPRAEEATSPQQAEPPVAEPAASETPEPPEPAPAEEPPAPVPEPLTSAKAESPAQPDVAPGKTTEAETTAAQELEAPPPSVEQEGVTWVEAASKTQELRREEIESRPAPDAAPEPPVEAPEPPVEAPEPPVEAPEPPVEAPEPPVEAPEPPVEAPEPPVAAPEPPVEAPEPPAAASELPDSEPSTTLPSPSEEPVPQEAVAEPSPEPLGHEVPAEATPSDKSRPGQNRPKFRVGEVPVYDEEEFLTELKRELSKCKRVDRPLTLILIRVSDLSQIVELFGKDFREPVLWHVAEQAMASLREVDLVGMMSSRDLVAMTAFASDRYGGGRIVSRMRSSVKKTPFRVGEQLPPIIPVLQFGMATFPQDGADVPDLMKRAETELSSD